VAHITAVASFPKHSQPFIQISANCCNIAISLINTQKGEGKAQLVKSPDFVNHVDRD
jgi:hypothetical protein